MTRDRVLQETEARQLPSVIAEWSERADVLRWVARALQLDLPLLIERPELVLPCLYRRCAMFGDRTFYGDVPRPADADDLAALVEGWVAARPMRWLRALRPPLHPLDAGVIEEYRTSIEGDLRFSADGSLVGVVGKDAAIGWERLTGRKIDDARTRLAPPHEPRWHHERAMGRILLSRGAVHWDLPVREGESMFAPVELSDDLVIINCSYQDDPYDMESTYAHYLVDVSVGRVLWRAQDTCFEAVLAGAAIRQRGNGIVLRSVATGEQLAAASIPYSRSIAFAGDGTLVATHDRSVIRIWDLAHTPPTVPTGRAGGGMLSPDGTRILAGDALWDARTGAWIARIPLFGRGNWLEGGPPANAWSLVDHRVVQVMPFRTTLWDSADGRQLPVLDISAGASDGVCADPSGRYLAICRGREEPSLTVRSLDDNSVLVDTRTKVARPGFKTFRFGWSETGDQLWWETEDGEAYVVSTADWQQHRLPRGAPVPEAPSRVIDVADGLLVLGDLAAPMDSTGATVSRDGRIIVGGDHYRLEDS